MPEVLKFLESQIADMDKFVDEVDCGDDWFCIYGSELGGLQKILTYAREQIQIQADFEKTMIEKIMQRPTLGESIEYAIRSNAMEGLPTTPETIVLLQKVESGEITFEEMRKSTDQKARRLAQKR
jgi:hypothetical protein